MNHLFKNLAIAGYMMAILATKFGIQSELQTTSGLYPYRVIPSKELTKEQRAFMDGVMCGIEFSEAK